MNQSHIIIGTRGSDLAMKQTTIVRDLLLKVDPALTVEVKIIKTTGDGNMSPIPLDVVGKGWFTKEIEQELQQGTIDIAVHSLKDLPELLGDGLVIGAITEREDPRDVLVSKNGELLTSLKKAATVGTDSERRKVQVLAQRPDLVVKSLRGNVPTRIQKLKEGQEYDAIILAAAGLNRLDLQKEIAEYFEPDVMTPAPGQGALAIEIKADNNAIAEIVSKITHVPTLIAVKAERAFSKGVGGGCKEPVGAYATCEGNTLTLIGMYSPTDIGPVTRGSRRGPSTQTEKIGEELAREILQKAKLHDA